MKKRCLVFFATFFAAANLFALGADVQAPLEAEIMAKREADAAAKTR